MLQSGWNGVRIPVGGDLLMSKNTQTSSGAHPATASMVTGVLSGVGVEWRGVKASGT